MHSDSPLSKPSSLRVHRLNQPPSPLLSPQPQDGSFQEAGRGEVDVRGDPHSSFGSGGDAASQLPDAGHDFASADRRQLPRRSRGSTQGQRQPQVFAGVRGEEKRNEETRRRGIGVKDKDSGEGELLFIRYD